MRWQLLTAYVKTGQYSVLFGNSFLRNVLQELESLLNIPYRYSSFVLWTTYL